MNFRNWPEHWDVIYSDGKLGSGARLALSMRESRDLRHFHGWLLSASWRRCFSSSPSFGSTSPFRFALALFLLGLVRRLLVWISCSQWWFSWHGWWWWHRVFKCDGSLSTSGKRFLQWTERGQYRWFLAHKRRRPRLCQQAYWGCCTLRIPC